MRPTPLVPLALLIAAAPPAATAQQRPIAPLPDTLVARVREEVRLPAGWEMSVFAAPPALIYPVSIETGEPGVLFAAVDPNLNLDKRRGLGRIVRLVDSDLDGRADRFTVFADSLDSVRGMAWDGKTLFVAHAPTLSAFRDTDGDGVADRRETLVEGFGFRIDPLGGDHTINGITAGIDGWLYVAVGDYGFVDAAGRDGTRLQLRGGGVVRVRPDGSEMEIYARGTRNIYDVAIDPLLNLFTRDNNNNGQGWGVRLHHLPQGADLGYPSLFRDFADEALPTLADYGAGAGTAGLWVHDPSLPEGVRDALLTADWGLGRVFRHPLERSGAGYRAGQEELFTLPRPADMVMDGAGGLYLASLSGGSYTYAGDHVGYIVRVSPGGRSAAPFAGTAGLAEARLLELLVSPNAVHRLAAQRELLRRGSSSVTVRRLEQLVLDARQPDYARVAAMFTLKQMAGAASHRTLVRAAQEPALRALALRALTDRRGELRGVPHDLFARSLRDPDPRVQQHAIVGLQRLGARSAAAEIFERTAGTDPVVSHLAVNALVELRAVSEALRRLDSGGPGQQAMALRVLRRIHAPEVVAALVERLRRQPDGPMGEALLAALARLYNRDAEWTGGWWEVQPSLAGPYYEPATWEESARIRPLLLDALLAADSAGTARLAAELVRHQVLPRGSVGLLNVLARNAHAGRAALVDAMLGARAVDGALATSLAALADVEPALLGPVAAMLVEPATPPPAALSVLRAAALEARLPAELRGRALDAIARMLPTEGVAVTAEPFARLEALAEPAVEQAWRRFTADRRHAGAVPHFVALARSADAGERTLGFATLVQIARAARNPAPAREQAAAEIEAGWADPARADALARAVERAGAQDLYRERLQARSPGPAQ